MNLQEIPIGDIYVSESAAQNARRRHFSDAEFEDLVSSIAEYGVLQPIIVRPRPAEGGYTHELVAGERRFLAAAEAGLKAIPALARELSDEQVLEVQLIENLQRKDLHPMQEAEGYHELMEKHGHTVDELADRLGKSKGYVYGRLKLLALCKEAREAFYEDKISASVAQLVARIPGHKLQEQALRDLTIDEDRQISYRRAQQLIQENYMLRLKGAPFPADDPDLHKQAGPCNTCPKRTGNQPELFGDIESADVCTDPVCFGVKRREHGDRQIKAAKADGRQVITGAEAKKIKSPWGDYLTGYSRLDDTVYELPGNKKVRQVLGNDAETTLLQLPDTGEVIEVVKESVVRAAVKQKRKSTSTKEENTWQAQQRDQQKKAKIERKFRLELYRLIRTGLPAPSLRPLAQQLYDDLDYESIKLLCEVRGFEPPAGGVKDYRAIGKTIDGMTEDELQLFANDCLYVRELHVSGWNVGRSKKLLEAAKAAGIDVKAIRKEVTPKPKKKAAKKTAKKKADRKASGKKAAA